MLPAQRAAAASDVSEMEVAAAVGGVEADNARGEQETAVLRLLHLPWHSGKVYELETRAAGESGRIQCSVLANYAWGSCAE